MTEALTPRWQEADEAVESLVAALVAAAARTADHSGRKRPRGRARSQARPKSTRRHIAEVIRAHKLAPGLRVDRNMVAALMIGHRNLVSNPVLVVAVARACAIIAGQKLSAKKAAQMGAASKRVAKLIARAEADTYRLPAPRIETATVAGSVQPTPAAQTPAVPTPAVPTLVGATPAEVRTPQRRRPHPGRKPRAHRKLRARRRQARRWWMAAAAALLLLCATALLTLR